MECIGANRFGQFTVFCFHPLLQEKGRNGCRESGVLENRDGTVDLRQWVRRRLRTRGADWFLLKDQRSGLSAAEANRAGCLANHDLRTVDISSAASGTKPPFLSARRPAYKSAIV
jgi:hypothetical protein